VFSSSEIAISYPGALYFKPKFALETVPGIIFSAKFGPSTIKFVYAKFRYHGKWGIGSNGTGIRSWRYKVVSIHIEGQSDTNWSRFDTNFKSLRSKSKLEEISQWIESFLIFASRMSPLHSEQCFEIYLLFDAIVLLLKAVGVHVNLLFWSPTDSRLDCCHTRNCRVDWYEGFILQFGHLFWSCLMTVRPGLQTSICLDNKQCLLMFGDQTFSVGRA